MSLKYQRKEGELTTFAAVVGPHDERDVLHADNENQRPYDQRQNAEYVSLVDLEPVLELEALLDGVERARADVAINNANC